MKEKTTLPKSVPVNLTMPAYLKESLKREAVKKGIPLNEFIRDALKVAIRDLS